MAVCVIPARGGSKRIPHKNIKHFCGQPMIAWSINAARVSGAFDRIVVSTDDDQIAQVAQSYGADVPFIRDASLSDDHAPTVPVIADATKRLGALARDSCVLPVCHCAVCRSGRYFPRAANSARSGRDIRDGCHNLSVSDPTRVAPVRGGGGPDV